MAFDRAYISPVHGGVYSLALAPQEDFSLLRFSVNQSADEKYPRDQVLGVSFWLNSGNEPLNLSSLAVAMMGSNAYPYWIADDTSVQTGSKYDFQETLL